MPASPDLPIHRLVYSRRRTLALIVQADGMLEVRAPRGTSQAVIQKFVHANRPWIEKKQAQALKRPRPPLRAFRQGETFPLLGNEYPLRLVERKRPALTFEDGFQLSRSALPRAGQAFTAFYKQEAARVLAERVQLYAARHGFQVQKIRISSARTRWGSCSARGTLSFTWRLVMAPLEVIDYVVVHELVHLRVRNHSKAFWAAVAEIMPSYKQPRLWLKRHGHTLSLDTA
jgi:predicted metal-dependent hydrolase